MINKSVEIDTEGLFARHLKMDRTTDARPVLRVGEDYEPDERGLRRSRPFVGIVDPGVRIKLGSIP